MERSIKIAAAYDKRDPNPSKNYGTHSAHIYFTVKGPTGGLTFSVSTGWHLPHVQAELYGHSESRSKPMAFGVDIHLLEPKYEEQSKTEKCDVTGSHCYCDGSGLLGDSFLQTLIEGGDEALFARMEEKFKEWS